MIPITISTEGFIVEVSDDGIKIKERIWITETKNESCICKGNAATGTEADFAKE